MPEQKKSNFQHIFFVVGEKPFCLWDMDIKKKSLEFLKGLNPQFFSYVAYSFVEKNDAEEKIDSQNSALLIRMTYSLALESFFALLASAIQAPYCVPAWINLYRPVELKNIVEKIQHEKPLLSCLNSEIISWSMISNLILSCLILEDKVKESEIKAGFAQTWTNFASEYLDEGFSDEYNSIKHGLRVYSGSHTVAIGIQNKFGEPVPLDKMQLLSKSDYGSSFMKSTAIGGLKHHQRLKRYRRNWSPNEMANELILLKMSITNIQSSLKITNGTPADQVQFEWPLDFINLNEESDVSRMAGLTSMSGPDISINLEHINKFSEEHILKYYKLKQLI